MVTQYVCTSAVLNPSHLACSFCLSVCLCARPKRPVQIVMAGLVSMATLMTDASVPIASCSQAICIGKAEQEPGIVKTERGSPDMRRFFFNSAFDNVQAHSKASSSATSSIVARQPTTIIKQSIGNVVRGKKKHYQFLRHWRACSRMLAILGSFKRGD